MNSRGAEGIAEGVDELCIYYFRVTNSAHVFIHSSMEYRQDFWISGVFEKHCSDLRDGYKTERQNNYDLNFRKV